MSHCFIDVKKRQKHSIYSVGGAVAGVTENYLGILPVNGTLIKRCCGSYIYLLSEDGMDGEMQIKLGDVCL